MRWGPFVAVGLGVLTINGCSRSVPEEYGPPPPNMGARAAPPELAGGPPPPPGVAASPMSVQSRPLPPLATMAPIPNPPERSGPRARYTAAQPPGSVSNPARPVVVVAMRPIPNPEDLSPAERRRVYDPGRAYRLPRAHAQAAAPRRTVHHAQAAAGHAPPAPMTATPARPMAKAPVRPAPAAKPPVLAQAPAPKVIAPKPAAAKPVAPAPMAAAPVKPSPKPSAAQARLDQLKAAVGGVVARDSALTVAPEIVAGKAGIVSLSLPATLKDTLKAEAAKLGLTKAARKAEVEATLSGEGYAITPNGKQSAALKAGEAARFDWQVAPAAGAQGPLKADVDAVLAGQGKRQILSLASIQSAFAPPALQAEKKHGFKFKMPHLPGLPFFGSKAERAGPPPAPQADSAPPALSAKPLLHDRTLPVVGRVSGRAQAAVALAALAVLILALVSRSVAGNRKVAERRRRYRTFQPMAMEERPTEA